MIWKFLIPLIILFISPTFLASAVLTTFIGLVALICWEIFVILVNFFGIKELRNVSGEMQTPIVYYKNPATNKKVIFVGMSHVGEKEYFEKIRRLVDELEQKWNYKVFYERVKKISKEEAGKLNELEKELLEQMEDYYYISKELPAEILGVEHQKYGLTEEEAPSSWVNNDATELELISLFLKANISFLKAGAESVQWLPENETDRRVIIRWLYNEAFSQAAAGFLTTKLFCRFSKEKRFWVSLVLDERNKVAVKYLLETLEKADGAVNIWGTAHLPGMDKMLKKAGFQEIHKEWLTVYRVRNYSFLECLGSFFKSPKTAS